MSMQRSFAGYRSTFKNSFYFDNVVTVDSEGKLRSSFRRTFVQKNPRKFSTPGCQLRISDGRSPSIFNGNSGNENLMYQGKDYGKKYSVNVPIHKYSVIPTTTHKHSTIASIHKSSCFFQNCCIMTKPQQQYRRHEHYSNFPSHCQTLMNHENQQALSLALYRCANLPYHYLKDPRFAAILQDNYRMLYVKSDNFIRNIWEKCGSTPYDDTYFGIHTISGTVSRKITQSSTRDFSKLSQKGEIK
uniref:DUF4817 domain-containing protein n=1 Tax=Strongyloides venezuelensis TaxID=75913 RepID=A0A0K0EVH4_STRVS